MKAELCPGLQHLNTAMPMILRNGWRKSGTNPRKLRKQPKIRGLSSFYLTPQVNWSLE
ncbi:hypothetical protein HNP33_004085 [Comamonas odontotermitis]|uniref:Uncharacterized protein n=1 Tax=Comamonas odontotermitis TaxID=379895 RepID=A0ABR6RLA1_9BURK|nr:hypothetical protein [Comamonas odontotermitis]MBB6579960.1 hypothetical protein [Comamonas odontotermitis]